MCSITICVGRLTLATEPVLAQLSRFYMYLDSTCDVKRVMQALSQLVQQWEGPGDKANGTNANMSKRLCLGLLCIGVLPITLNCP